MPVLFVTKKCAACNMSQFLIGKVELYIFMDCKFDDPIVMSQFLIGKVEHASTFRN